MASNYRPDQKSLGKEEGRTEKGWHWSPSPRTDPWAVPLGASSRLSPLSVKWKHPGEQTRSIMSMHHVDMKGPRLPLPSLSPSGAPIRKSPLADTVDPMWREPRACALQSDGPVSTSYGFVTFGEFLPGTSAPYTYSKNNHKNIKPLAWIIGCTLGLRNLMRGGYLIGVMLGPSPVLISTVISSDKEGSRGVAPVLCHHSRHELRPPGSPGFPVTSPTTPCLF